MEDRIRSTIMNGQQEQGQVALERLEGTTEPFLINLEHMETESRKSLDELDHKLAELTQKTARQLKDLPSPFPYVDEPTQRFLIHGGEWSEKWLTGAVILAKQPLREGTIPGEIPPGLPRRVMNGFEEWWKGHHKAPGDDLHRAMERDWGRLSEPTLTLNPIREELKIVTGRQRFWPDEVDPFQCL